MTFLTPWTGIAAGAIGVPLLIALYFLKLRRQSVQVSSTLLWRKAVQDLQANAPFQRLRKNILLLLQLLILGGLIFALMQPEFERRSTLGSRHVILLDRSASMGTVDASGRSRLERAKERAIELVDSLRGGGMFSGGTADEAMVLAFDVTGEVLTQFTSDKAALRNAIASITLGSASSSLADAMQLVRAQAPPVEETLEDGRVVVRPRAVGTLHLFTDGGLPDAAEAMLNPEDEVVYYAPDDHEPFNVGIIGLRATRGFDDPTRLSIFVGLGGSVHESVTVDVQVRIGQQERIFPVTLTPAAETPQGAPEALPPAATGSSTITLTHPGSAIVTVRLVGEAMARDALAIDNTAWLVVGEARRLKVGYVTAGNVFLSNALQGMTLAELTVLSPEEYAALPAPGGGSSFDVVVFDRVLPGMEEGRRLPPGRYLCLGVLPAPDLGPVIDGEGERAQFTLVTREHPATRELVLDSVLIARMLRVSFSRESSIRTLAMTDLGPGIIECWGEDVRVIATTFDPMNSTWPFDVSFPLFIADAIDYLVSETRGMSESPRLIRPGEVLADRLPARARNVRITEPNDQGRPQGASHELTPAADGRIVFGPIRRTGIYEVSWEGAAAPGDVSAQGRVRRSFASNLLDDMESDVRVPGQLALASKVVIASELGDAKVRQSLWAWILTAALLVIMLEWYIYNRKVHL
ncbi:MAG: BatA and WFA domain-containing protein [Phycisphaeraceae bacterium]|nr:BatA and WFA domain-containing protein [Phycisphaeraceae bacterium]